jgi:hypothetical protein
MISPEYQEQITQKHAEDETWGTTSHRYASFIEDIASQFKINEILDYGCGKGSLKASINTKVKEYDPGIPQKSKRPKPSPMVVCTDVLEHVEPKFLNDVLDDLLRVTEKVGFFDICTAKAIHTLPDGRNAHLIIEDMEWWLPKVMKRFKVKMLQEVGNNFWMIVTPK